jgi:hypothetical protein
MKTEARFRLLRRYFRVLGNPIFGDGQSVASRIYMVGAVISLYGCWVGLVIETLRHLENFEEAFEYVSMSMPLAASCWTDLFMRYRHLFRIYRKVLAVLLVISFS